MVAQPGDVRRRGRRGARPPCSPSPTRACSPGRSSVWLWLTVLFANLAEAVAEGRGKAQADTLRRAKHRDRRPPAARRRHRGAGPGHRRCRLGDRVVVEAGRGHPRRRRRRRGRRQRRRVGDHRRVRPGDPRVRRRPQRRSPAAPRCCPTGSSCRSPPSPGETLHRPDDRAGRGRVAAEDAERDRAEHPARQPDHHLPAGGRHAAAVRDLLRRRAVADRAGRAAGLPDPDHDRRAAVGHRHRRDGPAGAAQRAGHVRPGGRGGRRRRTRCCWTRPAPSPSATGRPPSSSRSPGVDRRPSWPTPPSCPAWPTRRRRAARSSCCAKTEYGLRERHAGRAGRAPTFVAVHRADPDERRRPRRRPADPQGRRRRGRRAGSASNGGDAAGRRSAAIVDAHLRRRRHAAGRRRATARTAPRVLGVDPPQGRRQGRACASGSTSCARWASAR